MEAITDSKKIEQVLRKNVEAIYPDFDSLKKRMMTGKKIRLYCGFDPSSPFLHLGNMAIFKKMAEFQSLGHEVIMLIGDFTGMIGDPTDKKAVRKKITREEVIKNSKNYKKIAGKILNFKGKNPARVLYNSKWLDKISFKDLIDLASNFTVQQVIARDMFQERMKEKKPIYLHEFLYPLAQAYDSVAMDIDLEIGGSDQIFNMLCGRDLIKALKGKEKFVLSIKLLTDEAGKKMGKTEGNAISITDQPEELRRKIMLMEDNSIVPVFSACTDVSLEEIKSLNPIRAKEKLADTIISMFYGKERAEKTKKEFNRVFIEKKLPSNIDTVKIEEENLNILDLLVKTKLVSNKSEAQRLVLQKGIKIEGEIQDDWKKNIEIKKGLVIQLGKGKFIKII
ncbi:MAG: tyrosine--tRNA ligase [Candidatus Nealsonbacteria bacterium]|nr:tyrosine--tRNA ligase [Candidatus Nealsonbacteria bacterium]